MTKHQGSCHCGAIKYTVDLEEGASVSRCNCSICTKIGSLGTIVKPAAFELLAPTSLADLGQYVWGGKISTRYFCKQCGVHCFGKGELEVLGGAFVSVNFNTLDDLDPHAATPLHWDGRHNNWAAGPRPTPYPIFVS